MTKTLIFHNPGEIDIRGACIAGLSAKETSSAIGYFGTGLKYSIACILRWGGSITIYAGTERYDFISSTLDFRGQEFKQVMMRYDGGSARELGFTTEYGKDWEPWQVFRELYANARDEGGGVKLATCSNYLDGIGVAGATSVIVDCPQLESCYLQRDEIILPADKSWNAETEALQFSKSPSGYLYYKNVRVAKTGSRYTWNFLDSLKLSEDRSLKDFWSAQSRARDFIRDDCKDENVIEFYLRLKYTDSGISNNFDSGVANYLHAPERMAHCTYEFARVAARLYRLEPVRFKELRLLACEFDDGLTHIDLYTLNARETAMLTRAKELVGLFGFQAEVNTIPIEVRHLGESILGKYEAGTIQLSPNCFAQGTKQVVSTLFEECWHAKTGHADCTYTMQTALFNHIISLNEEIHNVIC